MRLWTILMLCVGQFACNALAQEQLTYHGCTDAVGNAVPALADTTISVTVESRGADGAAQIHYNPQALPRLRHETRLFLFAQECARHNLGIVTGSPASLAEARRADCHGLDTLMRSGLLQAGQVNVIQRDLALTAAEWALVPGPVREFALEACVGDQTRGHVLSRPRAEQAGWNACVRACGEQLRACRSPKAACDADNDRCVGMCDFRFPS